MDLKLTDIDNSKKELIADLTYEELAPHFEKAIDNYRKKASIPGFRKGKAPLSMIKKLYGEGIEYSSLEDIVNDIFVQYVKDNNFDLLGKASISDMDYKPKENLKFKVEFEIFPEIKLEDYNDLELTRIKYIIDDSLVDDEIQYHRMKNASQEIDAAAIDDNYLITVDLQNLDEAGNVLIGESQKDMKIFLGNKGIYPEFKEGFKGIKEDEVRVIDSTNADGKPKKVQITCKKVEKIVYPEMNKEFFKKVTGKDEINTEEQFKAEIKSELQKIYDRISLNNLHNDVISELIKLNNVSAPEKYVDIFINGMIDDYRRQYPKGQLPKDFNVEEFKKEKRVDAILQAKWYLIREKLIESENIQVSEDDYIRLAEENAARFNVPVDKLAEAYKDNEEVKMKLQSDKLIDHIISKVKVKVVEQVKKKEDEPLIDEQE